MNKKSLSQAKFSRTLVFACLLISSPVFALTWSFNDPCTGDSGCYTNPEYTGSPLYYGGDGLTYGGDTIGPTDDYDILNLTAEIDGTDLTASIMTRFVEDPGNSNVLYGDLMLSSLGYQPFGNSPYPYDTATNSQTDWNFVVDTSTAGLSNIKTTGTAILYKNPATFILSDDPAYHDGSVFRADQIVLYGTGGTWTPTVTVSISHPTIQNGVDPGTGDPTFSQATLITYKIPLSDIVLPGGMPLEQSGIAIRWAMTCANDIVEAYVIPEPETLALFVPGLLGLVLISRSKKPASNNAQSR